VSKYGPKYKRQPRDLYETPPQPIETLLKVGLQFAPTHCDPWCGRGKMIEVFNDLGFKSHDSDIKPIGPMVGAASRVDFLNGGLPFKGPFDIVTNPPLGERGELAEAFIERALETVKPWRGRVAMLLTADFDSAKTRVRLFRDNRAFAAKIPLLNRIKWFDRKVPCKPCSSKGCRLCKFTGRRSMSPMGNSAWFYWSHRNTQRPRVFYAGW
jgi:hypothetical protein